MKREIKEKINKVFNSKIFMVIIGIILFIKTMFFYNNTVATVNPLQIETVIGTVAFIFTLICVINILPKKAKIIISLIVDFLISILLFVDNLYYIYSSNIISVEQISNLKYTEEIINTLPQLASINQIVYFIDLIIFFILGIVKIIKIEKKTERKSEKELKARTIDIVIFVIGIIVFAVVETKYIKKGTDYSWNRNEQIIYSTIYGYHISDVINFFGMKNSTQYNRYEDMIEDYRNLKNEYQENYGDIQYDFKGILEGKNILIIQLESVQEFVVNKKINGKEITPNLNKFLSENIQLTNMHMQSYSSTADSEHSVVTSTYPLENGMSYSKYFANTFDNLFDMFSKNNYYTSYMHGNVGTFWNRENVYTKMNIDDLKFIDKFEDTSEMISGYLSDELLYKQAVQTIKTYDEPFISFIVAASSHTAFDLKGIQDKEEKVTLELGKYEDIYFGNYLEAVNYADYAFGILIDELKKSGLYDETAIIVYGDHNGLSMYDNELVEFLTDNNSNINSLDFTLAYTRVLCGMKLPGVEKHLEINKVANKLDLKPTLAYLCNIEDGFSLGTNIFASKDFICLNNGIIIAQDYYYNGDWYKIETGEIIDWSSISLEEKQKLEKYYEYMEKELNISFSTNINDLLSQRKDLK